MKINSLKLQIESNTNLYILNQISEYQINLKNITKSRFQINRNLNLPISNKLPFGLAHIYTYTYIHTYIHMFECVQYMISGTHNT